MISFDTSDFKYLVCSTNMNAETQRKTLNFAAEHDLIIQQHPLIPEGEWYLYGRKEKDDD